MKFRYFQNKPSIILILIVIFMTFVKYSYADNLSNLKKYLNKGKIKTEQTNSENYSTNHGSFENPLSFFENPNSKSEIKNKSPEKSPLRKIKYQINDKLKKLSLKYSQNGKRIKDNFDSKIATLKAAQKNKLVIAKSEMAPSSKSPSPNITPIDTFPGLNDETSDTKEATAISDIKTLYEISDYFFPDNQLEALFRLEELRKIVGPYCEDNADYPYLCAILKYYYAEIREKVLGDPAESAVTNGYMTLEMFNQIYQTYLNVKGKKNEIIEKVVELSFNKVKYLTSSIDSLNTKIDNNIASINKMKNNLELLKNNNWTVDLLRDNYGNKVYRIGDKYFEPFDLKDVYNSMFNKYSDTINYYGATRNLNSSEILLSQFHSVYFEVPPKLKLKIYNVDDDGTETYVTDDEKVTQRDPSWYFDVSKKHMKWLADFGELTDDSQVNFDKTQELINTIQGYKLDPNVDYATEDDISRLKKEFVSSPYTDDQYYLKKPEISKLFFCTTENRELKPHEIQDPYDQLTLRGTIKNPSSRDCPSYSINGVKIHSHTSNRDKTITLKRDWIFGGYYAIFCPNLINSEKPEDNLINITPAQATPEPIPDFENVPPQPPQPPLPPPTIAAVLTNPSNPISIPKTISVFQGASVNYVNIPPVLYNSNYFNKQLVRSFVGSGYQASDATTDDIKKNTIESCKWFLLSGGAEFLYPIHNYVGDVSCLLVKNVATWFVIQGHGNAAGEIGERAGSTVGILPHELMTQSNNKTYSKYNGMKVLILDSCYSLRNKNAWRKVLHNGVILGYHGEVAFPIMDWVLNIVKNAIESNPNISDHELCLKWCEANERFAWLNIKTSAKCYAYIRPHPVNPNKNIACYADITLRPNGKTRLTTSEVEF